MEASLITAIDLYPGRVCWEQLDEFFGRVRAALSAEMKARSSYMKRLATGSDAAVPASAHVEAP